MPLDAGMFERSGVAGHGVLCVLETPDALLFAEANPPAAGKSASLHAEPVVASGVIRNRVALSAELGLNYATTSDEALLTAAYLRWGAGCCKKIYGDWCLAAWDEKRRELFLARDHHGNSALYYHVTDGVAAFSTSLPALLALKLGPIALDPLYLAQVLVSWLAYQGEHTAISPIKRVPPAHYVIIGADDVRSQRYWNLEEVSPLGLAKREDYAAGLRDIFDQVVGECLPSAGTPATTLSCGLDSGSVTATAAPILARQGRRLAAYVSIPVADFQPYIPRTRIGDELPLAQVTAAAAGNVDLFPVSGPTTPIAAMRRVLEFLPSAQHAAANFYWLLEVYGAAAQSSAVLLTGQVGNGSISWSGELSSQPLLYQLQKQGLRRWAKQRAKQMLPPEMVRMIRGLKKGRRWERSAIRPEFAAELNLFERWSSDPMEAYSPQMMRALLLQPGRSLVGDLHAGFGAATGIAVIDPTADPRVLEFCYAVPDSVFIDPVTDTNRWLIRAAMKDRLPDAVRLNRLRGIQAADLVPRLRACRGEVEDALEECACGAAADYLDVPHMRRVWHRIETEDNIDVFRLAITVLTRGIMAGLFVNGIGKR
jgi:asparagine synthase (glutamine-hydrolysing)